MFNPQQIIDKSLIYVFMSSILFLCLKKKIHCNLRLFYCTVEIVSDCSSVVTRRVSISLFKRVFDPTVGQSVLYFYVNIMIGQLQD